MIYSSDLHPEEHQLSAYLQQPDLAEHADIALHLASCDSCRQQLTMMSQLKSSAASLQQESCDDQQQKIVDDYIYSQLSKNQKDSLEGKIKNNPLMLKSALHGLSRQASNKQSKVSKQTTTHVSESKVIQWLHSLTSNWLSIPVTALASVMLTVLVFQFSGLFVDQNNSVTIASYQDNKNIRFLSQNRMPGIGFFSSARQHSMPYQNIKISMLENELLELQWQAVESAKDYNLKITGFSDSNKTLREKITTVQTRATIKLTEADFNRRIEWTLSGDTTQGKTFVTSGGFVINRNKN